MYQNPNHINTMQSLAILDKCTQIIRQDRIWLRNLIKANNQDALLLFKGLPKIPNMKELQIKIRKYINRAKQRQKQQQLQRFKQNMHLPQFIDQASQKKIIQPQTHNKSQNKTRNPLVQNQSHGTKSSFVAKWNNYTHYNHQNNFMDSKSQISQLSSLSQQDKNLKKQWSNNYKPHSFNRNLNGQLANKLSYKNKSTSNLKHNNTQRLNFSKQKSYRNNEEQYNLNSTQGFGQSGRNSSKSLRQLQNRIYEELRIFQNHKSRKQNQVLNKTHSHHNNQNYLNKEKPSLNFPQTQKSVNLSRQNIDQILKFKLGNCDFQSYKKQKTLQNEQDHSTQIFKEKNSSSKKLYNQGLFPPIQQQTQRDSESQRYAQEPLRFGLINSKQQTEDRHKFTFSTFAKTSPQLNKSFKGNQSIENNKLSSSKQQNAQFYENQGFNLIHTLNPSSFGSNKSNTFVHPNYQQPQPQKKATDSLYQSAEKKNDFQEQYFESDLHKSIMNSIKKSKQQFPSQSFHYNSRVTQNSQKGLFNSGNYRQVDSCLINNNVNQIKKPMQVSNFQMNVSLYGSNGQDSLFTSPQLLNQCRNFLKKTQQINFQNSGLKNYTNSIQFSKFDSPLHSNKKSFKQALSNSSNNNGNHIYFPQPITITQSITKDFYDKNSESKINSLFQSKPTSQAKQNNNIDFQTYSKPLSVFNHENSYKKSQFIESSSKKQPFMNNQLIMNSSNKPLMMSQEKHSYSVKQNTSQQKFLYSNNNKDASVRSPEQQNLTIVDSDSPLNKHRTSEFQNQKPANLNNPQLNNKSQSFFSKKEQNNHNQIMKQQNSVNEYKTSQFKSINFESNSLNQQQNNSKWSMSQRIPEKIIQTPLWYLIQYQDIVDTLLQANEGNIQVNSMWLKHTLQNQQIFKYQVGSSLKQILSQFIKGQHTYNCIQIFQKIQQFYKRNLNYQPRKCPSRDIYLLLDIQQKGFITFDDIKSFIQQLQNAQLENIEQIKRNILEVFESADFMEIHKISYTNLYIIKNQDSFEQLCSDLQQFQFQIEG